MLDTVFCAQIQSHRGKDLTFRFIMRFKNQRHYDQHEGTYFDYCTDAVNNCLIQQPGFETGGWHVDDVMEPETSLFDKQDPEYKDLPVVDMTAIIASP